MKWKTRARFFHKILFINILLVYCYSSGFSQTSRITPRKLTLLTNNLDSLVRSYVKKGFILTVSSRDVTGLYSDHIQIEDGFEMELQMPFLRNVDSRERQMLQTFGAHISELTFETEEPDSLYKLLTSNQVACTILRQNDSSRHIESFVIDSSYPLNIIFERAHRQKTAEAFVLHKNHVYRLDWVLLSAGRQMQETITKVFTLTNSLELHGGCCDFWRTGPLDDLTFFRFEPLPPKSTNDLYWLSIEPDNFYWAYW
jgi:hypothetical protein